MTPCVKDKHRCTGNHNAGWTCAICGFHFDEVPYAWTVEYQDSEKKLAHDWDEFNKCIRTMIYEAYALGKRHGKGKSHG